MSRIDKDIAMLMQDIADPDRSHQFPVMTGVVVADSVDLEAMTCDVTLSSGVVAGGVLLNGITESTLGVIPIPTDGSLVWVAALDGASKYGVVRCSSVLKVLVAIGDVTGEVSDGKVYWKQGAGELTMQGGKISVKNGSTDLKTVLNNILSHVQAITVPTGVGPSGVPINAADFVSDNSLVNGLLF